MVSATFLAIVMLDGHSALSPSYVVLAALWTVFCITAWWVMWGPRRR